MRHVDGEAQPVKAGVDFRSDSSGAASSSGGGAPSPGGALGRERGVEERRLLGKIGRYTLLGQIAGGGMGSVFVAQMRGPAAFSRLVAIKCLHTRWLEDPKYVARFTTEVKLSTLIRHPNVVQTVDVVEESGELFLVMEYVDGVTLAALLADLARSQRLLPIELALGILSAVLRGLHAAHEAVDQNGAPCHIVHRDVSPQNIMLGRSGHVQVLDFGAAKAVQHSQHTAAGVLVGKLAYMAPEQVRGERSSPGTDVFSAGVVLWEALVGQRLFHDPGFDRGELLHALVLKPVARPSRLRAGVSPAVDAVVERALARNPQRRYRTAREFADALDAVGAVPPGVALAELVSEVCGARLADKDALLRAGLEAASEASRPTLHALAVPAPQSFPAVALPAAPQPRRGVRVASLGAALLAGSALWWGVDALRRAVLAPSAGVGSLASAERLGAAAAATRGHDGVAGLPPATASVRAPEVSTPPTTAAASDTKVPVAATADRVVPLAAGALPAAPPIDRAEPEASSVDARLRREPRRGGPLAGRQRRAPRRSAAAAARNDGVPSRKGCDPPTYMDAAGIRHYKRDCL